MIEKVESNLNPDFLERSSSKESNPTGAHPDIDADVSVNVNFASFIDKAMQVPEPDADAVRRAKELLETGELANPDNTRKAAAYIIDFGI
jgi:hypothetical protein